MQNIIIFKNREIYRRNSDILGIWGENNYETLCFGFYDDFIDGDAILEFEFPNGQKKFVELEKDIEEKFYKILIKSSLLQQEGDIKLELKIINENEIIYKTKIFIMKVLEAINATATFEDDYPDFVTTTTAKLEELEKNKQDKLVPGENITIKDGVISATGGSSTEETDPTVPSWAKAPNKPTYTAEEVGALPDNTLLFSGDYNDLTNKPIIPSIEGLATETYVDEKVSSINISDEVVIGTEEPTTDDWKIFIDESEEGPEYITKTVNDLVNYYKKAETYTQEEINQKISAIPKFSIEVVETLPTSNISATTVYLLKTDDVSGNLYTEYIYVNNIWEKLGTQEVDFTGYATETYVETKLNDYVKTVDLSSVATSGSYNDLSNKPIIPSIEGLATETYVNEQINNINIPTVETEVLESSTNPVSGGAVKTYVDTQIGNIETILTNIADESEAI